MIKRTVLRENLVVICSAFTCVVLSFAILPDEFVPTLSRDVILQTFILCSLAAVVVKISYSFHIANFWLYHIAAIFSIFFGVFGVGSFIFKLIPVMFEVYVSVGITILIVYFLCTYLLYEMNKKDADEINKRLNKNMKRGQGS